MKLKILIGILISAGGFAFSGSVGAASIAWVTPQNISGDSDVSTTGVLDRAYAFGGSGAPTTVNGVTFVHALLNADTTTFTTHYGGYGGGAGSAAYQALLTFGDFVEHMSTIETISLTNLIPGAVYQVETWANDTRIYGAGRTETVSGSGVLSYSVATNAKMGQFVIGTFTADAPSQTLSYTAAPASYSQVNALELRVVPEPCISLLACVGLTLVRRRRRLPCG